MRRDRLWLAGGALCSIVLLAVGWFFFIQPEYQAAESRRAEADVANDHIALLQRRLTELRRENEHLAEYKQQLAVNRSALPTTDSASDLLRELQLAGELTGVTVTGVTVGAPSKVNAGSTQLDTLPISLTAAGPAAKIDPFLDQLQTVQPRALLISNINVAPGNVEGAAESTKLTVNLQAFYASGSK